MNGFLNNSNKSVLCSRMVNKCELFESLPTSSREKNKFYCTAYIKKRLAHASIFQKQVIKEHQATFHFRHLIESSIVLMEFI